MTAEGRENTNKILYVLQLGVVLCLIAIERLSSLQESRVARSA